MWREPSARVHPDVRMLDRCPPRALRSLPEPSFTPYSQCQETATDGVEQNRGLTSSGLQLFRRCMWRRHIECRPLRSCSLLELDCRASCTGSETTLPEFMDRSGHLANFLTYAQYAPSIESNLLSVRGNNSISNLSVAIFCAADSL